MLGSSVAHYSDSSHMLGDSAAHYHQEHVRLPKCLHGDKTLGKVSERFYWVGMVEDVNNFCKSCDQCQRPSRYKAKKKSLNYSIVYSLYKLLIYNIIYFFHRKF